jgi:hypothetical protein
MQELLKYNTTRMGTLRFSKMKIPKDFLPNEDWVSSFLVMTLMLYVLKNKSVELLSVQNHVKGVSVEDVDLKPQVILNYKKTKWAADFGDKVDKRIFMFRSN